MAIETLEATDEHKGAWFNFEWSKGIKSTLFVSGVRDEVDFLSLITDKHFGGYLAVRAPSGRRFFINTAQVLAFEKHPEY